MHVAKNFHRQNNRISEYFHYLCIQNAPQQPALFGIVGVRYEFMPLAKTM